MAHLSIHERRVLHDIEQQLSTDRGFTARFDVLRRQPAPPQAARRVRPGAAIFLGGLVAALLASACLLAGPALLAFVGLVTLLCVAPWWVTHQRRAHTRRGEEIGHLHVKKATPRLWLRWQAQQLLARPRP